MAYPSKIGTTAAYNYHVINTYYNNNESIRLYTGVPSPRPVRDRLKHCTRRLGHPRLAT